MKHFWILLGLLPSLLWAQERQLQWLNYDLEPVEAGSELATYYYVSPVRDGERWAITLYHAGTEEAVPALETQLDGPDFATARMVGKYTRYRRDGSIERQGTFNDEGKVHGEFTNYQKNGDYTVTSYREGIHHGSQRRFYANGQLKSEKHFVNGEEQDGERIHYDENGVVKDRFSIVDGEKHGVHERLNNGVVAMRIHYKHGKIDGLLQRFTSEGQKVIETAYVDNKKHGVQKEWAKGKLSSEMHYRKGKRHGSAKRWKNGVLVEEVHYVDGRKRGESHYFYSDGTPESYQHHDETGQLTEQRDYDKKGNLTRLLIVEDSTYGPVERNETFRDGKLYRRKLYSKNHRWVLQERYEDGGEEPTYRRETVDRKKHGRQISASYLRDNAVAISHFRHGVPVGDYREVDKDGNVLSRGHYEKGKKVGDWVISEYGRTVHESYDNEGRLQGERREVAADDQLLVQEHYVEGELHGEQIKRREDGRLVSQGEYRRGEKVGTWREYDDSVKGTFEGEYVDGKRSGPWLARSDDGYEMARFHFENGDHTGKSYVFTRNGSLREIIRYKNGKKHGRREGYNNGTLTEVKRFRNGERHGLSEFFLPGGERYMAMEYENGAHVRMIDDNDRETNDTER